MAASLLCIVKDDAQGVARAAVHAANTVAQIDAVVAARAFHRPVTRGKNDRLSAVGEDHLRLGLRAGLLLDMDEFSTFPIAPLLAKQKYHLQRKADLAVEILMQTIETAGLVVKHERRGLGLPGLVANFQKCLMVARIWRSRFTQRIRPVIANFCEMRISAASELGDQLRQRIGEYL